MFMNEKRQPDDKGWAKVARRKAEQNPMRDEREELDR